MMLYKYILYFIIVIYFQALLIFGKKIKNENLPLIITTWNFTYATAEAWQVLNQVNTSIIDAIVAGCSRCEFDQCDGTVGYGGSPDENAETTLDAMIIDGTTMNMGAVANLRGVKEAIKVARHVLENTRHSMLAGDQATDFAVLMGFKKQSLSTAKSKEMWRLWKTNSCQPNFWQQNVIPNPELYCGPYRPIQNVPQEILDAYSERDFNFFKKMKFGRNNHDTIGMVVIDKIGNIAGGTSTNGAKYKIPGRVGDSPIPGAGAYAISGVGGAAATGDGDIMMRFLPAFTAVENLRKNLSPHEAAIDAMQRILVYYPNFVGGLIVARKDGVYDAACAGMDFFPFSIVRGHANQSVKIEHTKCLN